MYPHFFRQNYRQGYSLHYVHGFGHFLFGFGAEGKIFRGVVTNPLVRTRNDELANSVPYVSQQRGRTWLGFREILTHAFSPGTSGDGARGHSNCCDFVSLLL